MSASQIRTLTRYDPAAAAVFVAVGSRPEDLMGVGRLHRLDGQDGEFAVLVRSDLKGHGLGRRLLEHVIEAAPGIGVGRVVGLILRDNTGMLALAGELGFSLVPDPLDPGLIRAELALADMVAAATPDQLAAQAS